MPTVPYLSHRLPDPTCSLLLIAAQDASVSCYPEWVGIGRYLAHTLPFLPLSEKRSTSSAASVLFPLPPESCEVFAACSSTSAPSLPTHAHAPDCRLLVHKVLSMASENSHKDPTFRVCHFGKGGCFWVLSDVSFSHHALSPAFSVGLYLYQPRLLWPHPISPSSSLALPALCSSPCMGFLSPWVQFAGQGSWILHIHSLLWALCRPLRTVCSLILAASLSCPGCWAPSPDLPHSSGLLDPSPLPHSLTSWRLLT